MLTVSLFSYTLKDKIYLLITLLKNLQNFKQDNNSGRERVSSIKSNHLEARADNQHNICTSFYYFLLNYISIWLPVLLNFRLLFLLC